MKDGFDKAKDVAQIVSLIAIPVLLAVFGYAIQATMKDSEIRRDYVKIAVDILSNEGSDGEVKEWATRVLAEHSPVPFDTSIAGKLGASLASAIPRLPELPKEFRVSEVPVPTHCESGCLSGNSMLMNKQASLLGGAKRLSEGEVIDMLVDLLDQTTTQAGALSEYADFLRIAGGSCERVYDRIRAAE